MYVFCSFLGVLIYHHEPCHRGTMASTSIIATRPKSILKTRTNQNDTTHCPPNCRRRRTMRVRSRLEVDRATIGSTEECAVSTDLKHQILFHDLGETRREKYDGDKTCSPRSSCLAASLLVVCLLCALQSQVLTHVFLKEEG